MFQLDLPTGSFALVYNALKLVKLNLMLEYFLITGLALDHNERGVEPQITEFQPCILVRYRWYLDLSSLD